MSGVQLDHSHAPANTLPKLLVRNARAFPERIALREKEYGIWQPLHWAEYLARVRAFALGLERLGIGRGDKIAILGDNRPEWVIAELAAQSLGAVSMGLYQDAVAEEVRFLVEFSEARLVVAEDQEQVDKILETRDHLPRLEHVVFYDPKGLRHYPRDLLLSFPRVEALGREGDPSEHERRFDELVEATTPTDVALFSTTSGTTGKPKLAMLTHANLLSMAEHLLAVDPMSADDEFVSFLPLAWIGEQVFTVSCALEVGYAVNFPEEPETVQENIREIGPQTMFSPPRIWENLVSDVQVKIEDASRLKRRIYDWAMRQGERVADVRLGAVNGDGSPPGPLRRRIAELVCLLWLRDQLGLRRIRRAYTGGAALGPDVFRFFHAIGVNLKQLYGQTEVSGISVLHRDDAIRAQTVGMPLPETEIRLGEDGEILTRGPAVFQGYYRNEEATREALDNGWLHSGDAGMFDESGHLIVIDRKSDVMTLPDGTRFSPQFLENKLKFSPYVREAVVFGGGEHPFVTALVTIDFANVGKWAERRQLAYTTFTDLSQNEAVYDLVRAHVERTNRDLPDAARIRRFLLLYKELDADDEELTRTRKVRRSFVAERYAELVGALYGSADSVRVQSEITYQDGTSAIIDTTVRVAEPSAEPASPKGG